MASTCNRAFGGCRTLMAVAKSSSSATAGKTTADKTNKGILKVVPVSPQLGKFLGANEASRTEAVKKVWHYVKQQNLQDPANKKEIRCDEKLKTIFNGKDSVGFLDIARLLSQHFVKSA